MFFQYSREFLLITAMCAGLLKRESTTAVIYSPKEMLTKSLVQEWSHGSLMDFQAKVAVSELSLIFYYAPWCAESLVAKKLFKSVANSYHEEAYFSAVNCWQSSSICRMNYLYQWPVLIAYFSNSFSVQYNGEWNPYSIAKFIDVLLAPIVRIYTMQQLVQLKKSNDAIVFGVFRSSDSKEYQAFFQASLKRLEINSFQSVTFATYIGDEHSIFLNEKNAPTLRILTANDTIVYGNSKWLPEKIIYFFKKNVIILRNNICSTLSSVVKRNMQFGPVLLMLSPTISTTLDYSIMKEIVYNYKKGFNTTVLKDYINYFEKDQIMQRQLTQFCKLITKSNDKENRTDSQNVRKWADILSLLGKKGFNVSHHEASYHDSSLISLRKNCYKQTYCKENLLRYHITKADFSFNTNRTDYRSPLEILKRHFKKRCSYLGNVSQKFLSVIQADNQKRSPELYSNETMAIFMLPNSACSHYFKHFLGDIEMPSSSPSLLIVDKNAETSYVQKDTFTLNKTIQFIDGLRKGTLPRHLRSSLIPENRNFSKTSHVKVKELNSSQFSNIMQWTNMTLVILIYSPQCPACHIISQKLLHISHIVQLRNVQFYRLDGTANDLPWEFTTDKYPTLFVFPQKRSMNANTFTSSSKINVRNLLGFILSQLKPDQQLYSIINACKLTKISLLFQNCIQHARVMVSDQINNYLRKWSHLPRQRIMILQKLTTLKKIYFELVRARKSFDLECILKLIKI